MHDVPLKPPSADHGVRNPVGRVIIALPPQADAALAREHLESLGVATGEIEWLSDAQMLQRAAFEIDHAGPLDDVGQELALLKEHRAFAERGCSFLILRAQDSATRRNAATVAAANGALTARYYGNMIIEELIQPAEGLWAN